MNWTQFLLGLAAIYSLYYLLNIVFDLLRSRGQPSADGGDDELIFSEEHQPQQIETDQHPAQTLLPDSELKTRQAISSGPMQTTGGVSIRQLLNLVQDDLIEYTKAIPY